MRYQVAAVHAETLQSLEESVEALLDRPQVQEVVSISHAPARVGGYTALVTLRVNEGGD